jgi:hypothetical protein
MAAPRSPKYPSIPLGQAIELASRLWEREKKTPVGPELVGQAWGYKGDSGPVRAKIGSLRQYGLLDGTRDGVKVSDLAVEIIVHEAGSPQKLSAMATAAMSPPLFSEVYASHRDSSADSLRAYLITKKGFNPDAATQFVSSFKDTIALADPSKSTYHGAVAEESDDNDMSAVVAPVEARERGPVKSEPAGSLLLKVPFRGSELSVRIEAGQTLTKEHLARVRKYLELAEDDLANGTGEPG